MSRSSHFTASYSALLRLLLLLPLLLPYVANCTSILFEGGTVISYDTVKSNVMVLYNTSVLVTDNQISSIFPQSQNISLPVGTEIIPSKDKILSPGFVDTHRHLWQTAFKTIASNTTLAEYFYRYGEFTEAGTVFTPEDVYYGQLVGIYESLNSGVTSIIDHAHHTWSNETAAAGLNASIESGGRIWWCYSIHNLTNGYTPENQIADFQNLSYSERLKGQCRVSLGLAYDNAAIDPVIQVRKIFDLALQQNVSLITMHYLGGPWGFSNSPQLINSLGYLDISIPIVFSHGSYLTVEDARLLRSTNQHLSITPESEMHYGQDHVNSYMIQDQASLGVDTHFTYSNDIVTQARIWLQSVRLLLYKEVLAKWQIPRNNPMSVNQAFLLATRSGGLALRRPDIGILAVGAKADIVVFNGDSPNMLGWVDPVAAVMLHSNVGDVQHVMVDGKFVKRDFKLTVAGNYTAVQQKFLSSAKRIQGVWETMPLPVLEGEFQLGSKIYYGDAETVDVIRDNSSTGY